MANLNHERHNIPTYLLRVVGGVPVNHYTVFIRFFHTLSIALIDTKYVWYKVYRYKVYNMLRAVERVRQCLTLTILFADIAQSVQAMLTAVIDMYQIYLGKSLRAYTLTPLIYNKVKLLCSFYYPKRVF